MGRTAYARLRRVKPGRRRPRRAEAKRRRKWRSQSAGSHEQLIRSTNDRRLVQWICERAGGFFILNPKTNKPHPDYLIPATNEIVQEFADLLSIIAVTAADNQITPKEAKQIRARWEDLKSVTEGFVACCEEGNFAALKDKPPGVGSAK